MYYESDTKTDKIDTDKGSPFSDNRYMNTNNDGTEELNEQSFLFRQLIRNDQDGSSTGFNFEGSHGNGKLREESKSYSGTGPTPSFSCLDNSSSNLGNQSDICMGNSVSLDIITSRENVKSDNEEAKDNLTDALASTMQKKKFQLDKSKLHSVSEENQSSELAGLGLKVYNQDELEQDIIAQVDDAIEEEVKERQKKIIEKTLQCVNDDISSCLQDLQKSEKVLQLLTGDRSTLNKDNKKKIISVRSQIDLKLKQLNKLRVKKISIKKNMTNEKDGDKRETAESLLVIDLDEKIRKGEMTPFGTVVEKTTKIKEPYKKETGKMTLSENSAFDNFLLNPQNQRPTKTKVTVQRNISSSTNDEDNTDRNSNKLEILKRQDSANCFDSKDKRVYKPHEKDFSNHKANKRSSFARLGHNFSGDGRLSDNECGDEDEMYDEHLHNGNDSDYVPDKKEALDSDQEWEPESPTIKRSKNKLKRKTKNLEDDYFPVKKKKGLSLEKLNSKDDGDLKNYEARLKELKSERARKKYEKLQLKEEYDDSDDSDFELDDGFKVPGHIWNKLYPFQKTGVRWLWELHTQEAGGIVGDEMGLGKTIQMAAFLAGLAHSKLKDHSSKYYGLGPTIIVAPTTVMHQWVKEFHKWTPHFRVAVLHNTGSYTSNEESLVHSIVKSKGILVTAFSSVVIYQEILMRYNWHYVVLDEGHKIRNPDAQMTIACKQFRTCHRIILSGSPMQNNLKELWSLFDFVFPGKLGTLPDFMTHFSVPIVQGGYSNASQVQVQTAFKCASVLRDTINPYLLRRMKSDVKDSLELPGKNEQVLFCRLTDHQKLVYQDYLDSRECKEILRGNFMVFPGLITLRKICNHPDLCTGGVNQFDPDYSEMSEDEKTFGYHGRSGKMMVVLSLLRLWHKQGHRVLLFSQGTQMLNILQGLVNDEGYSSMRMDGRTSIGARQGLIDKFNNNKDVFVFLLTTRVGGLGVNLCGANRVILFDPDWNPSTDTQARERAWRIGQEKQVTIYRLLTSGTIEEKIYHRQIFKQFLTNRVLKDPKQRRFFKSNDLFELFTLSSDDPKHGTETGAIFAGTGSVVSLKSGGAKDHMAVKAEALAIKKRNRFDEMKAKGDDSHLEIDCDEEDKKDKDVQERLNKMREFARKLSQQMEEEKKNLAKSGQDLEKSDAINGNCSPCGHEGSKRSSKKSKQDREKKKKHKKHKKKKDIVIEGETISHLCKHSTFKTAEDDQTEKSKQDDDYVLQKLFKKSGVHSALQHDTIMLSSNPDYALVEGEAEKVAKEAAAALKKSRVRCHAASAGIPTWTGRSGGNPSPATGPAKPRFGQKKNPALKPAASESKFKEVTKPIEVKEKKKEKLFDGSMAGNVKVDTESSQASLNVMSSSDLILKMKQRNILNKSKDGTNDDEGDHADNSVGIADDECMEFITDIRNFIAFRSDTPAQATTQELLDEFSAKVPNSDSAKFRAMLREICTFRKFEDIGIWRLRSEFR